MKLHNDTDTLIAAFLALLWIAIVWGLPIYIAVHFIIKYW